MLPPVLRFPSPVLQLLLLELCAQKNLSINGLARLSGVHLSTVKGIMNGSSCNPGIVTIKKLCDGLGITLIEFFDNDDCRNLEQEIR